MRTDQTSGVSDAEEPFEILRATLARFHLNHTETMLSIPRA
jgi:hypothetical protein